MTTKDRLKMFVSSLGLGRNKFETLLGLSNGYISSKSTSISSDVIEKIASTYPNLNIEWLITGKEPMFKPHQEASTKPQLTPISTEAGTPEASVLYQIYNDTIKRMKELMEENTNLKNQIIELSEGSEEIAKLLREIRNDNKKLNQENRELRIEVMIKDAQLSEKEKAVSDYKELLKEAI